jgi:uncharacterized membrane protein YvbJ
MIVLISNFQKVQNNDAASFLEYIKYEESMKSPKDMIIALYERAVAINCTDAGLWQDYVLFIVSMGQTYLDWRSLLTKMSIATGSYGRQRINYCSG